MSWVAVGTVAVGAISAGVGASSANKAAKGQQGAADAAIAEQQRQYDLTRGDQAPYREAGTNALANLVNLSGQYGKVPTAAEVMATPGYQFGLDQGRNALEGGAAARGGLYSGAAGKALVGFGNDYGTRQYDAAFNRQQTAQGNIWNRYSALSGIGQTATNQVQQAGQNYANQAGGLLTGNANAQGAATIAQGNALANGINQGVSWWNNRPQQQPVQAAPIDIGGYDPGYWAEGGPVRKPEDMLAPMVPSDKRYSDAELLRLRMEQDAQLQAWKRKQLEGIDPRARIDRAEMQAVRGYAAGGSVFSDGLEPNRLMPRVGWSGPQVPQPAISPQGAPQTMPQPLQAQPLAPTPPEPPQAPQQPQLQFTQTPEYDVPSLPGYDPNTGQVAPRMGWGQPNRMQAFADGGRVEPVIGSRMPLPQGGTGGGLDTNALLRMLIAQQQMQPQMQQPLPADPLMNPRAILAARMRATGQYAPGGAVHGPGGPKDDMIPAQLSNGEHVVDTASVNAIGGGNNAQGQNRLNQLRAMLKGAR